MDYVIIRRLAKRGRVWSKLARRIIVAAKGGGGNPDENLSLRYAIDDARVRGVDAVDVAVGVHDRSGAGPYRHLEGWQHDVFEFAAALRDAGEAAGLSRETAWQLARDTILGAEVAKHYKPDPECYLTTADMLGLPPGQVLMVAAHKSDLDSAAACGLRTAYVHRPIEFGTRREAGDVSRFDVAADDFEDLAAKLGC